MPRWRLPLLFAGFVLALLLLGVLLHLQGRNAAREAAFESLHSTSRLSAHGLNLWIAERYADADMLAGSPLLLEAMALWAEDGRARARAGPAIQAHLDRLRDQYGYRAVALLDTRAAAVLFSSGRSLPPAQAHGIAQASLPGRAHWIELPPRDAALLDAGIVRGIDDAGRLPPLALYLEIEPARLVDTLRQAQPLAWAGETLLVRRSPAGLHLLSSAGGAVLQPLDASVAGRGRQPGLVAEAQLAQDAQQRLAHGLNRMGSPVLAMREAVNMPAWVVVSELGEDAVYAPLYQRTLLMVATLLVLLALGALAFAAWRRSERDRQALREAGVRSYYEAILRHAAELFVLADARGRIVQASDSACQAFGYPHEKLLRKNVAQLVRADQAGELAELARTLQPGQTRPFQLQGQRANGDVFAHEGSVGLIEIEGARYYHTLGRDVTAQRQVETRLRIAASFYERSAAAIVITDPRRRVVSVNAAFTAITGYEGREIIGESLVRLNAEPDAETTLRARAMLDEVGHWEGELLLRRANGEVFPARTLISVYCNAQGQVEQYVDIFTDLSRLKHAESQAEYLAHYDRMTGLPNRAQLERQLPAVLELATRERESVSLALLNVDRFKNVNDTLGHAQGDALLVAVAQRLRPLCTGANDLFRYGGDEFVLLMVGNPVTHALLLSQVRAAIAPAIALGEHAVSPTASIGIASYPEHAKDAEGLLRNAEAAMRMAKAQGRNTWRLYEPEMNASAYDDMLLAVELRQAIERRELQLHLQPQFRIDDGALVGMEALLRWQHAVRGGVSPARFIPIAESSGQIVELGDWALNEACRLWAGWRDAGLAPPPVAVNISALQFHQASFLEGVARAMATYALPAQALELELTEGLIMSDTEKAIDTMHKLVEMGIQLAIDDFGTGYSSLSYLRRFPVRKLKIDRSFVLDLGKSGNREGAVIATAVIGMAKNLHLTVIAEGVETVEQRDFLRAQGCDEVQGYLYARPLPPAQITELLQARVQGRSDASATIRSL